MQKKSKRVCKWIYSLCFFKVSNGLVDIEIYSNEEKNDGVVVYFFRQKPVKRHCWRCSFHTVNFFYYFFLSTIYNVFFVVFFIRYCNYVVCKAINHQRVFFHSKLPLKHRSTTLTRYHLAGLNSYLPRWHKSFKASKPIYHTSFTFQTSTKCIVTYT